MKTVMIFGTFDNLHDGHRALIRQATEHGDRIIAIVARDETVKKVKGHTPKCHECERVAELLQIDVIDDIVLGYGDKDKMQVVRDNKPNVVLLGYDQKYFVDELYELADEEEQDFIIVRAQAYKPNIYKSSLLNKN
jgi:FAD synthetase